LKKPEEESELWTKPEEESEPRSEPEKNAEPRKELGRNRSQQWNQRITLSQGRNRGGI
jgi:hypothetical protein